jgi:hypothetical protein
MGAALKEGTRSARGKYIVWVMGDNSDDLSTIPKFIRTLKNGADIVFGSRYMKGGSGGDLSVIKKILSAGYTIVTKTLFGLKVHDITNAFRGFRKEAYADISPQAADFSISPEFAIKAHLKGYRLEEVPTTYKNRKAGLEKFRMMKMGIVYAKLLWQCSQYGGITKKIGR